MTQAAPTPATTQGVPPPDLLIVGAGPAGISAALEARAHGLSVLVLDDNPAPGGRIWQALEARSLPYAASADSADAADRAANAANAADADEADSAANAVNAANAANAADADDAEDADALRTLHAFRHCGAGTRWRAAVWSVERDGTVSWTQDGAARSATARVVLLATGATERPLPVPGWTLPGVMTVGAAQIALKTAGLLPAGNTWIAGQGPLLLLYAVQALRAGGRIAGILDLSDGLAPLRALRHLPVALRGAGDIAKGLAWRREIAAAGVPWISATALRAEGDNRLQRIGFRAGGHARTEPADLLLLHDGIIPSLQITRALDCSHVWDRGSHCWKPRTDGWGVTSLPNVMVAGDGAGIAGAQAAALSGRLAALQAAHMLGRIDTATRDACAAPLRAARGRHLAVRPFLEALYAPRPAVLDDATIVCRCEEVAAGEIRAAARLGCLGLNQLKAFTRCGMGPCQGRMCGTTAAEVLAAARGVPVASIEPFRARFPTRRLTVGELAGMAPAAG